MEGVAVFLIICFVITSLLISCRWYFIRLHVYNEWVAEQQRIQRRAAEQNGIVIFTIEGESRAFYPANRQTNIQAENAKRDELPCYEDALKLPKPGENQNSPLPLRNTNTESTTTISTTSV